MKKTMNAVLLSSLFFISYSSAAVTVEDILKSQQTIKAPNGMKDPNNYDISRTDVNEPISNSDKKTNFFEFSTGSESTTQKIKKMLPTSGYICSLNRSTGYYGRGLKGMDAQVYQSGGYWYLKSGRASCGGCATSAQAICFSR
nr:hypothetical protein [Vibrio lentus]PMI59543.1 hypothetical protein BCU43_10350 [Vibrio lentus]